MNNDIIDLSQFRNRPEQQSIDLMEDEAKALMDSPRCVACNHLSIFHQFALSFEGSSRTLVCRFGCECE